MRNILLVLAVVFSFIPNSARCQGFVLPVGSSIDLVFNHFTQDSANELQIYTKVFFDPIIGSETGGVRVEAFENNTSEAPIGGGLVPVTSLLVLTGAWNDLQGVVRISALTEPVHLDAVRAYVVLPDRTRYSQIVTLVPEPSTIALFAFPLMAGLFFVRSRKATA